MYDKLIVVNNSSAVVNDQEKLIQFLLYNFYADSSTGINYQTRK